MARKHVPSLDVQMFCTACRSYIQGDNGCTADETNWNRAKKRLEAELRGNFGAVGIGPLFPSRQQVLDSLGNPMFVKKEDGCGQTKDIVRDPACPDLA